MTGARTHTRWRLTGATSVVVITWVARVVGLLALVSVLVPAGRRTLRGHVADWLELPQDATVAAAAMVLVAGVLLVLLAAGLRRRKRRAWQLAVAVTVLLVFSHLGLRHVVGAGVVSLVLLVALLATRQHFIALPDPVTGKWRAVRVFGQLVLAGFLINLALLTAASRAVLEPLDLPGRAAHSALALVGVTGPAVFHAMWLEDLTAAVGALFGLAAILTSSYFLLRSAEPSPRLSAEEKSRLRRLLAEHGERDSLGYFALREDKFVVFSRSEKAALTYRVIAGVALCSADPLGDSEAWPGVIEEFLEVCRRHGWVPAAMGCSELGATVWSRFGLEVLEIGDEAVVDAAGFTLEGRAMRGVRQAVSRLHRAGYEVRIRRAEDIPPAELAELGGLAAAWRGTETERGFSMALGRLDERAILVTAEQQGAVRGLLQFVPWGITGLSMDVMRRDRAADNGVTELMIASLLLRAREHGIAHVSLNFAAFRAVLEQGRRIGAGPVARLSARMLRWASRWIQIESLYRFNAKFQPRWTPRYLVYPAVRELPRVGVAVFEAEGLGGRSPRLLRVLRR